MSVLGKIELSSEERKIYSILFELSNKYMRILEEKIRERMIEMEDDDKSHFLIYKVFGITNQEGELIDQYQNKGRFLYKYAGAFLEEAAFLCIKEKYPQARKVKIDNTIGAKPKTFEIDCLAGKNAHEIKWRDATTDGDHVTKEHTRIQVIKNAGYVPIRVMFYYPNREQAKKIQEALKTLYKGVEGKYYYGDEAWDYIFTFTGIGLKKILELIAFEKEQSRR